jgi:chitin synthase
VIFAMKENNGGKLDSHLWFFNAFVKHLQPTYCLLLDVGTVAKKTAICELLLEMEDSPQVAGCCGEIALQEVPLWNFGEYVCAAVSMCVLR